MQFYTFPLLAIPLAAWAICAAFLVYGEVKMVADVVHNRELSRAAKILWSMAMVPFLPIAALAYYLSLYIQRHQTQHNNY